VSKATKVTCAGTPVQAQG